MNSARRLLICFALTLFMSVPVASNAEILLYKTESNNPFSIFYGNYSFDNVSNKVLDTVLYFNMDTLGTLEPSIGSEAPRVTVSGEIPWGFGRTASVSGNAVMRLPNTGVDYQIWDVNFLRTNAGNGGYFSPPQVVQFNLYGTISSSVPEPKSYGMILLGLCILGFVARRKFA